MSDLSKLFQAGYQAMEENKCSDDGIKTNEEVYNDSME